MISNELIEWLIEEKKMSIRSAKDVLSRCGRICRMLDIDTIDENTFNQLIKSDKYNECSMFIKSQLKRTVTLYSEFLNEKEKR